MANPGRRVRNVEILNMLLEKADVQGYLTTDDLIEVYPDVSRDAEHLEAVMVMLRRRGVDILDHEQTPYDDDEPLDDSPVDAGLNPFADLDPVSSDDTIGLYLKEMSRVALLSAEEEVGLAQRSVARQASCDNQARAVCTVAGWRRTLACCRARMPLLALAWMASRRSGKGGLLSVRMAPLARQSKWLRW